MEVVTCVLVWVRALVWVGGWVRVWVCARACHLAHVQGAVGQPGEQAWVSAYLRAPAWAGAYRACLGWGVSQVLLRCVKGLHALAPQHKTWRVTHVRAYTQEQNMQHAPKSQSCSDLCKP